MNETQPAAGDCANIVQLNQPHQVTPGLTCPTPASGTFRARQFPVHHFRYLGQRWTLRKRATTADARWQLHFKRRGETVRQSLGTCSLTHAEAEAKVFIAQWLEGRRRPPKAVSSVRLDDVFRAVDRLDMLAETRGRKTYVWGARKVFGFALDLDAAGVDRLPLAVVNGETGQQFWTRVLAHATALASQTEQNKFKRQARGWFNCTKALFAADAVRSFPACGLGTPDPVALEAFRKSKPTRFKVSRNAEFIAPAPAVLRETFRQWIAMGRKPGYAVTGGSGNSRKRTELQPLNETARRNMFIAIGLMLACALRKNEVRQIRWRHLAHDPHGVPRLIARDVKVKKGDGVIEVKPLNPFWHILQKTIDRHGWRGAADEFVLTQRDKITGHSVRSPGLEFAHGGHSDRTYWPFYHVGKWLRSLGWNLQKTNHALRDCAASLVTMKFHLLRAKVFCRHEQLSTTESHYSRFVNEETMDDPKKLAWLRWAK